MKPTRKEIEIRCENLKIALINSLEADARDTENKLERIKLHNELLLAKDALQDIKFN